MVYFVNIFYIFYDFFLIFYLQGRKLLPLSTSAGLTPLSLAIINGQAGGCTSYEYSSLCF